MIEPNAMQSLGNGFLIFAPHVTINKVSFSLVSFGYLFHQKRHNLGQEDKRATTGDVFHV